LPAPDSGDDSAAEGGDAGAPFVDISALSGLVLWLDAGHGVAADATSHQVSLWTDRSSDHNDMAPLSAQGGPPLLSPNGFRNNHPSVNFGPLSAALAAPPSSSTELGTEFLIVLAASVPSVNGMRLVAKGTTAGFSFAVSSSGVLTFSGGSVSTPLITGQRGVTQLRHILAARRFGSTASATLELRVDGAVDATATGAAVDLSATAQDSLSLPMTDGCSVAEVVMINGTTSQGDVAKLESFLRAKYGL
jgi:hypothetical protein